MNSIIRLLPGAVLLAALSSFCAPALAQDWEMPEHWDEIGSVEKWRGLDAMFYRVYEDVRFLDASQFKVDQRKRYQETRVYGGRMDGVTLPTWLTLEDDEQQKRRAQARSEMRLVVNFRNRIEQQAQRTRQNLESGWGINVADVRAVGDVLTRLNTATWLDPSNPFAWHLLAYFADLVGDVDRAEGALVNARAALDLVPAGRLDDLRRAVTLDLAWLYRDRGSLGKAAGELDRAIALGAQGVGPVLLGGLIAAQTGDMQKAGEIAARLKNVEIRAFPPNLQTTSFGPELPNIAAWRQKPSNYMSAWILATAWLYEGNTEMAQAAFREYSLNDVYPFPHRFWNDAGWIYEVTGRRQMAQRAWSLARTHVDYIPYMVYKPYGADLARLTGRPGPLPYDLGFDRYYLSGSRLAYAAGLVERLAAAADEMERQELAARALEQVEILQDLGRYPGQARVLAGQVYYLMGDLHSALIEVEGALKKLDEQGDQPGLTAVLAGLSDARDDLDSKDIANFFGQSGASTGRWAATDDPEKELAELRRRQAAEPSDAHRRDLARFLIRGDAAEEGRALALGEFPATALESAEIVKVPAGDIELILEADRALGSPDLALALVGALEGGAKDPWNDAGLWAMAGFIALDAGHEAEGRIALERASELDPGNYGLKVQLALMGE